MKYATWKLKFDNPKYGHGPQDFASSKGVTLTGAYMKGDAKDGLIVGYVEGEITNLDLSPWSFTEITSFEALSLVQSDIPEASMNDAGKIIFESNNP